MPEFKITWEIELEAEDAVAAAEKAMQIQHDPENIASVFTVTCEDGHTETIDVADHYPIRPMKGDQHA